MTNRSTAADFVTAFATGWPEHQPDIMVLSLTTHRGMQDFAFNKEQALLIAKTIKETAAKLAKRRRVSATAPLVIARLVRNRSSIPGML
jgi:hypothetical protein